MLDRVPVVSQLEAGITKQNSSRGTPLVGLIHGYDTQCHDMLLERLKKRELPDLLRLGSARIEEVPVAWPTKASDPEDFRQQLTQALSDHMRRRTSDIEEARQMLLSVPAHVMISTHVLASELDHSGWSPMDEYLGYWNDWPHSSSTQRIFIFLAVKYRALRETSAWGFLKRRQAVKATEKIRGSIEALKNESRFGNIILKVLPELGEVTEQDALNWAGKWGPNLHREIKQIFREHEERTRSATIPMEEVTHMLQALLTGPATTARGAA
jgi:hypothetical protein